MNSNILQVKNLTVELDDEKIIDNLSFNIKRGEFLTILGPNGSGKTVLLKALLGLLPYSGKITWSDEVKIGYVPQGLTQLKVRNLPLLVEEFFRLKKIKKDEISKLLILAGIKDKTFLKKKIGNLSGGQFQRMLLIWALSSNPNVLLFDEPTTGVDISGEETVYNLLYNLREKKKITIFLITHDLNIVSKYSTDVLCMSRDNVCHNRPQEVLLPEMLEKIYKAPVKYYQHKH
jgi:zinc transport system ATP-binding protein